MLLALPAELTLKILAFLSLHDVSALLRSSSTLAKLVGQNERAVYHNVALRQGYARPEDTLDSCRTADPAVLGVGHVDWKELCRRYALFDKNWQGQGTVVEGAFFGADMNLLTVRIDEGQRNVLFFDNRGGIIVRAMETGDTVWEHPDLLGRAWQPLFSDGYIAGLDTAANGVFCVRTWRRGAARGAFGAHKTLHAPPGLGLRTIMSLAHGTLAVCAGDNRSVLVFDVPSGALRATVAVLDYLDGSWAPGVGVHYTATTVGSVFIARDCLSVCLPDVVLVIPLVKMGKTGVSSATGGLRLARTAVVLPSVDISECPLHVMRRKTFSLRPDHATAERGPSEVVMSQEANRIAGKLTVRTSRMNAIPKMPLKAPSSIKARPPKSTTDPRATPSTGHGFQKSCLSPSGRHIAIGTMHGTLYLLENFARVASGAVSFADAATVLRVSDKRLMQMAWPAETRILVQTDTGICVVNLGAAKSSEHYTEPAERADADADARPPSFPRLAVHFLPLFARAAQKGRSVALLESLVCLTPTGVWSLVTADALLGRQPETGAIMISGEEIAALLPSEIGQYVAFADFTHGVGPGG